MNVRSLPGYCLYYTNASTLTSLMRLRDIDNMSPHKVVLTRKDL